MITKKQRKNNTTKATNKPYNLNEVKTKTKAKQPKKQSKGALNLFFSLLGFVVVAGALTASIIPTLAKADTITKVGKGTFIKEDFSCKVALADFAELQRVLEITPRTDFKYKMFLSQFESVTEAMNSNDCEVK
jgi:hypothetical protein